MFDKDDAALAVGWLAQKTGPPLAKIGLSGVFYGAATSLQTAPVRPDLAFVAADCSYSSLVAIASVQAGSQFGSWATIFVPGAMFIAGVRAGFNPADASPENAVRAADRRTRPELAMRSSVVARGRPTLMLGVMA